MKSYYTDAAHKLLDPRPLDKVTDFDSENLFNVRVNGQDIETLVSRELADQYLGQGLGFVQVYRADKPLEGRRPAWTKAPLPRPKSLRCGAVERATILNRLQRDPDVTMHGDMPPYATHSDATFAVGAL